MIKHLSKVVERCEVCVTGDTCVYGLMNRAKDGDGSAVVSMGDGDNDDDDGSSTTSRVSRENLNLCYLRERFMERYLLCELAFLDPLDREKARERGHLDVMDIESLLLSHG